MGDVIGFVDGNGDVVASYEYDAWGNCEITQDTTSVKIATLNPIRYRGYYWDSETGFYYLQSRYYDPAIGRFLNADGYITTGQGVLSYNMFAYCGNNPVSYTDSSGYAFERIMGFFNEIVESVKIFKVIKDFFDKITTPIDIVKSVVGTGESYIEHSQNTVNTLYNQENNASEPVSENFEPYKYIEIRTGVSYNTHIDTIIKEDTIEYLTDITKGRSWEEIVEDGDVYEVCHTMIYWDNTMYNHLGIYNQGDMSYTYFDALYPG